MSKALLITNDFPPRPGGIQSYVHALAMRLPADSLVVYTASWKHEEEQRRFDAAQPFPIVRHPRSLLLPNPWTARRSQELVREHGVDSVWFGAAAPFALLANAVREAGVKRVVASTHGHEVGWSMTPGARQALRRIGSTVDTVTYVSQYALRRVRRAFGPGVDFVRLAPGVDAERFQPDSQLRETMREQHGFGEAPVLLCLARLVPRKGQDVLIKAMPTVLRHIPDAVLAIVGGGPCEKNLRELAEECGVAEHVRFAGRVPEDDLPAWYAMADVFAMPCRTRGWGLDVEGLGIVFLEASAAGLPVIAGDSGGAPETVREGETGTVVSGRSVPEVADAAVRLLSDSLQASKMGAAGRAWVQESWGWDASAVKLAELLDL
ncbi:MAG: glycosyltransferase family 4 protein [Segniliparus sp.]|uniref:glycosyltransferase family 4 protein n=1 Tax=Segniliparus sp. TaxID=2804064 RepID=UPI003F2FF79B